MISNLYQIDCLSCFMIVKSYTPNDSWYICPGGTPLDGLYRYVRPKIKGYGLNFQPFWS